MTSNSATAPEPATGIQIHIGADVLRAAQGGPSASADDLMALALKAESEGNVDAAEYLFNQAELASRSGGRIELQGRAAERKLLPLAGEVDEVMQMIQGSGVLGPEIVEGPGDEEPDWIPIQKSVDGAPQPAVAKKQKDPSDPKGTVTRHSSIMAQYGAYTGLKDPVSVTGKHMKLLRSAQLIPAVWSICDTRAGQCAAFSEKSDSIRRKGWRIRMKDPNAELTPELRHQREFLENLMAFGGQPRNSRNELRRHPISGEPGVWSGPCNATGDEFERALPLTDAIHISVMDRLALGSYCERKEPGRDETKFPVAWVSPADAMVIWPTLAAGPYRRRPQVDGSLNVVQWVQVSSDGANQVVREFDYRTMGVLLLNPRTDEAGKGFGRSPVEISLDLATALMNSLDFGSSYFNKNHIPAGILEVVGQMAGNKAAMEYMRQQVARIGGPEGLFKLLMMPFAPGQQGAGVKFHPIRSQTGATSEMALIEPWFNMLFNILCGVFNMNSEEVGFAGVKVGGPSLSQGGQGVTLQHSLEKGRDPLLKDLAAFWNQNRIRPYDPDGKWIFEFTGLVEHESAADEDLRTKKQARGFTPNDIQDQEDEDRLRKPVVPQFYRQFERKFERGKYDSTQEWREDVDSAYEKAYWKVVYAKWEEANPDKELDEVQKDVLAMTTSPWATYTDMPVTCPEAYTDMAEQRNQLFQLLNPQPQMQMGPDGQPLDPSGMATTPDGQQYNPGDPFGHGAEQGQVQEGQQFDDTDQDPDTTGDDNDVITGGDDGAQQQQQQPIQVAKTADGTRPKQDRRVTMLALVDKVVGRGKLEVPDYRNMRAYDPDREELPSPRELNEDDTDE